MKTYSNKSKTKTSVIQKKVSSNSVTLVDNRNFTSIQRKVNTTGLPDQLKSGIENLSGIDMSDTKVHYNSSKPAQLNAHAYAQGTDIHLASGQEKHLPHEAWHVVQQKQGRVKPTMQMKGKVNVNDDSGLEKEADVMGAKALQKQSRINDQHYKINLNKNALNSDMKTIQRFKVPLGLNHLSDEVQSVIHTFSKEKYGNLGVNAVLYGSDQWAKDTYWAADRKLDEWNLVKHIMDGGGVDLKDAIEVGFGISDTTEADAISYDKHNNVVTAGENKIVSGSFAQVVENINSALSQLTTGKRAHQYNKTHLTARIHIHTDSGAYKHMIKMSSGVSKGMITRWTNRLNKAYKEGLSNWSGKCTLSLLIIAGGKTEFNKMIQ